MKKMRNKTRLGISTYSYPYAFGMKGFDPPQKMDAFELIKKAIEFQLHVVQIADNYPLHILSDKELQELDRYAQENKISIEVGTRGIEHNNLVQYIHITEKLHSNLLRVVIDTDNDKPTQEEVISRLEKVIPMLEERKIILGIENHDRFKSSVFAEIIKTINSPYVGIVLDTVNSFACEEGTKQVLDELAPYTVNFHMKDFRIERIPNALGLMVTGTIAGEGRLDFLKVLSNLEIRAKTDFSTIIELWMPPEKSKEQTLEKEKFWVKQSVENLKRLMNLEKEIL